MNQVVSSSQQHSLKVKELLSRVGDLQKKLEGSKEAVETINKKEIETSFLKNLRGKTDAEISKHVKELGKNLVVTQEVVLFLIELNHEKNEILRAFHDALVEKILDMEADQSTITDDINVSQRNEKSIVYQIKTQIEDRLAMEASIDANSEKITSNEASIDTNSSAISINRTSIDTNSNKIANNEANIDDNSSAITKNRTSIDASQSSIEENKFAIEENEKQLDQLESGINRNSSLIDKNTTSISDLLKTLSYIEKDLKSKSEADKKQAALLLAHQQKVQELTQRSQEHHDISSKNIKSLKILIITFGAISVSALALSIVNRTGVL